MKVIRMSMVKRNVYWPFRIMDSFFDDIWEPDFTLTRLPVLDFPKLDIKEGENEYTITVEAPGYSKEDLTLEVKDNVLRISSEHKEEKEEETKGGYLYKERTERSFSRALRIPENVKAEDINATLENGILTLTIPKRDPVEPRRIEIKNAEVEALPEGEVEEPESEKIEEKTEEKTE